jgi:hypothetical protein
MTTLENLEMAVMDCPKEVVIWNYFDQEHVVGTHYRHYQSVRLLEEKDHWALCERTRRLPILGDVSSHDFLVLKSPTKLKGYHFGLFKMQHDIDFEDLGPERCLVINKYQLHVPWFLGWLGFLWRRVTHKWFWVQWKEDVPMRLRRRKVWKLGFVDFVGLDYVNHKTARVPNDNRPYPIDLPVTKSTLITTKGFPRLFAKSEVVGYGD